MADLADFEDEVELKTVDTPVSSRSQLSVDEFDDDDRPSLGFKLSTPEQRAEWDKKGPIGWLEYADRQRKIDLLPFVGAAGAVEDVGTYLAAERLAENDYGPGEEFKRLADIESVKKYAIKLE